MVTPINVLQNRREISLIMNHSIS